MPWSQVYAPLGGIGVSALVAALPVVVLMALLAFWHVRAHLAAGIALLTAGVIAVAVYGMPAKLAVAAAGYGAAFGLLPIGWLVVNAIFIYQLSVETGQFVVLQQQIAGISRDRRIQALMLAFAFGAFIEGAAGFGAPVAISGGLMIGLGFRPLEAAKLALIGNTAPVAFGSLGIPLVTLAPLTGLDLHQLSAMVGRQLPIFSLIVPFWLVAAQVGWRGMIEVWPACLTAGGTFAIMQFVMSNFHGPWLVDIVSAAVSMFALVVLMRFWKPADEMINADARRPRPPPRRPPWPPVPPGRRGCRGSSSPVSSSSGACNPVKNQLNAWFAPQIPVPALHLAVQKMPPVAPVPTLEKDDLQPQSRCPPPARAAARRHRLGALPRRRLPPRAADLRPDLAARARVAADDLGDDGARLHDALQRDRHDDGARHGGHRGAVPVLLADHRLARRRAHRQRHLVQRALRQPAEGLRRALGLLADADVRRQQLRRRDGQDDRRAEHRRRRASRRAAAPTAPTPAPSCAPCSGTASRSRPSSGSWSTRRRRSIRSRRWLVVQ